MSEGGEARNHEAGIEAKLTTYLAVRLRTPEYASAYLAHDVLAFLDAVRCAQGRDNAPEVDRLRAGISFVRGLCTDRASYSVIDERLGELLDGETT